MHAPRRDRSARWAMLALGVIAVLAAVAVDPAAAALLLDADFLVVLGAVGLAVARGDVRQVAHRLLTSPAAVLCRAGVAVTRSEPRSLLR